MARGSRSYGLAVAAGTAALLVVLLPAADPVRVVCGLLLALVLPGAALLRLLVSRPLRPHERLVLTLGASIALCVLVGLLLDLTPWGLRTGTWALVLAGLVVAGSLVPRPLGRRRPRAAAHRPLRLASVAPAVLAVALAATALGLARADAVRHARQQATPALWILPTHLGAARAVRVGFVATGGGGGPYRVVVSSAGRQLAQWELEWTPSSGAVRNVPVPGGGLVQAQAFRGGALYRSVHLRLGA